MNYSQLMSYDEVLDYVVINSSQRYIKLKAKTGTIKVLLEKKGASWELKRYMTDNHLCSYKTLGKIYDYIIYTYLPKINPAKTFDDHVKRHQIPQPPVIESGVTGLHDPSEPWRPSFEDTSLDQLYPIQRVAEYIAEQQGHDKPRFVTGDVVQINDIKLLISDHNPTSGRYTVFPFILGEFVSATTYHQNIIDTTATKIYSLTESEEN